MAENQWSQVFEKYGFLVIHSDFDFEDIKFFVVVGVAHCGMFSCIPTPVH